MDPNVGWNRPRGNSSKTSASTVKHIKMRLWYIVAFILAIGAIGAFYLGEYKEDEIKNKVEYSKKIRQRNPQISRDSVVNNTKEDKTSPKHEVIKKTEEEPNPRVVNGIVVRPPWAPNPHGVVTSGLHRVKSVEEKVFKNYSDQQIAALLINEPGEGLVGDDHEAIFKGFEKQFLKSLNDPIIIEDSDTDFVKDLKRAVIETKSDLKARYDAGENITKVMIETRKELRELGLYRDDLNRQLNKVIKETKDLTSDDLRDLVSAANKMLEERGAKKLTFPESYYRRVQIRANKIKRNQQ